MKRILGSIDLTLLNDDISEPIIRNMLYRYGDFYDQRKLKDQIPYINKIDFWITYTFQGVKGEPGLMYSIYRNDEEYVKEELVLQHSMHSYLGVELLKRVLSEKSTAFKKECDLDFKDLMNLLYVNSISSERVFTREQVTAYFKEFADKVTNGREISYYEQLGLPYEYEKGSIPAFYTTEGVTPFVDKGIFKFLEKNDFLKMRSLSPRINSSNMGPFSDDEIEIKEWFECFLKNQEYPSKKPELDILKTLGIENNTLDNVFSEIFEEEDPNALEVKFL